MVRFKLYAPTALTGTITMFQSHDGSIQTASSIVAYPSTKSFNPTMVRFKLTAWRSITECRILVSIPRWFDSNLLVIAQIITFTRFNPTMVRFKLYHQRGGIQNQTQVSIPRWFDSNPPHIAISSTHESLFQSHDGSIQTSFTSLPSLPTFCFNPTMVRFKPSEIARKTRS